MLSQASVSNSSNITLWLRIKCSKIWEYFTAVKRYPKSNCFGNSLYPIKIRDMKLGKIYLHMGIRQLYNNSLTLQLTSLLQSSRSISNRASVYRVRYCIDFSPRDFPFHHFGKSQSARNLPQICKNRHFNFCYLLEGMSFLERITLVL